MTPPFPNLPVIAVGCKRNDAAKQQQQARFKQHFVATPLCSVRFWLKASIKSKYHQRLLYIATEV